MTESKWCRCEDVANVFLIDNECLRCKKPWRRWKNIKGTELVDYPMTMDTEDGTPLQDGTPFHLQSWNQEKYIYLMRHDDKIVIMLAKKEEGGLYYHNPLPKSEIAEILLQDQFEIVESENE